MRTTLTVANDLMLELKKTAQRRGLPLKQLVEEALRTGLAGLERKRSIRRYKCPTFSMGTLVSSAPIDKALALAANLEDDEISRELDLRK